MANQQILDFLNQDVMRHLPHLKYLERYGDAIATQYFDCGAESSVLLSHPLHLSEWDATLYAGAEWVLIPSASGQRAAEALVEAVQQRFAGMPLVCKFCDPVTRDAFLKVFPLQHARTNVSYTTSMLPPPIPTDQVVIASTVDERISALYIRNGYSLASVAHHFAEGGQAFTVYEDDEPVCSCMTFHNFGDVWEIGGLHTLETARRKGYARQVVAAALNTLLKAGYIPRYQVESTNSASLRLAESLGMTLCLSYEHYILATK